MKLAQATLIAMFAIPTLACDSGGGEYVKKMEEIAAKTCECKDADCTAKASKELADWTSANAEKVSKVTADDTKKITEATKKMTDCATKAATAAAEGAAK